MPELMRIISSAMKRCAKTSKRPRCDDCPLQMYCDRDR